MPSRIGYYPHLNLEFYIDPGSYQSGFVIFEDDKLKCGGKCLNFSLTMLIWNRKPSLVVIEEPISYKANKYVDMTLVVVGRFLEAADTVRAETVRIPRKEVLKILYGKEPRYMKDVDGNGYDNDKYVQQSMEIAYPDAGKLGVRDDAWQALALKEAYGRTLVI